MLKLVLTEELVRTVLDERRKMWHILEEYVSNVSNHGLFLLAPCELFGHARVDHVDFLAI
jgi:hypothetical protein